MLNLNFLFLVQVYVSIGMCQSSSAKDKCDVIDGIYEGLSGVSAIHEDD